MDNNMNGMDYSNVNQFNGQEIGPNPVQPMGQSVPPVQPMEQPVPPVQPMGQPVPPVQPMEQPIPPVQPMGQPVPPVQPMGQPVPPTEQSGEVPVISIEQTPTEVFGEQVNMPQPNDPTMMNQMMQSINEQQQPEAPKYGYVNNNQKTDLNNDSNINLKVVIFIAILIFAFIMAMPYLSDMLDKH